jgi:hypothetical protein
MSANTVNTRGFFSQLPRPLRRLNRSLLCPFMSACATRRSQHAIGSQR